jgi:hypothetical protein
MPQLQKKDHSNHAPVVYSKQVCNQVASILMQRVTVEQNKLLTTLKQLSASGATLTFEEAETLKDTARMCAMEAERVYAQQQRLIGKSMTTLKQTKEHRYFMDADEPPPSAIDKSTTAQQFHIGQCVMLQNLVTHSDLNNRPARVVDYKDELGKYVISVANPRGYWYATEDKLKSIDKR